MDVVTVRIIFIWCICFGCICTRITLAQDCSSDDDCKEGCCFKSSCKTMNKTCCPISCLPNCPDKNCNLVEDSSGCPRTYCSGTGDDCDDIKCPDNTTCVIELRIDGTQHTRNATCRNIENPCDGFECPGDNSRCYFKQIFCFVAPCPSPTVECGVIDPCLENPCNASSFCEYRRYKCSSLHNCPEPQPECFPTLPNPCDNYTKCQESGQNCYVHDGNVDGKVIPCPDMRCSNPIAMCSYENPCIVTMCSVNSTCQVTPSCDKDPYCPPITTCVEVVNHDCKGMNCAHNEQCVHELIQDPSGDFSRKPTCKSVENPCEGFTCSEENSRCYLDPDPIPTLTCVTINPCLNNPCNETNTYCDYPRMKCRNMYSCPPVEAKCFPKKS